MATGLSTLTSETFDEEIGAAGLPVVVDVWADWSPPCKALDPVLASIADERAVRPLQVARFIDAQAASASCPIDNASIDRGYDPYPAMGSTAVTAGDVAVGDARVAARPPTEHLSVSSAAARS